jgi:membrane protein CcdC involved in cytochrome C biogenesis
MRPPEFLFWEKLPPLVAGPVCMLLGVVVFLVPYFNSSVRQTEDLVWGVLGVILGLGWTIFGLKKRADQRRHWK